MCYTPNRYEIKGTPSTSFSDSAFCLCLWFFMTRATTNVMSDKLRSTVPFTQWFYITVYPGFRLILLNKSFSISYDYVVIAFHLDLKPFDRSIYKTKALIYMISTTFYLEYTKFCCFKTPFTRRNSCHLSFSEYLCQNHDIVLSSSPRHH